MPVMALSRCMHSDNRLTLASYSPTRVGEASVGKEVMKLIPCVPDRSVISTFDPVQVFMDDSSR